MVGAIQGGINPFLEVIMQPLFRKMNLENILVFIICLEGAGAFMGPALVAVFVTFFQDTRFGLIPIAALFIMGAIILLELKATMSLLVENQ